MLPPPNAWKANQSKTRTTKLHIALRAVWELNIGIAAHPSTLSRRRERQFGGSIDGFVQGTLKFIFDTVLSPLVTSSTLMATDTVTMEPLGPMVHRRRILTNPAAEYVETRAGTEALLQLLVPAEEADTLQNASEFVSELDKFAPKGVIFDATKYYEESEKRKAEFHLTLRRFVSVLKERHIDTDLDIVIKDPKDFTADYVLGIINKIEENRENAPYTKSCKTFIRKCFRKVEDNRDVIEGIFSMVPDDVYGSVISGGFTMILAAVEKHANQREAIQTFLAEIPDKLERIQRLSDIHRNSYRIHSYMDSVLVCIFNVLERIINKVTKPWKSKVLEPVNKVKGFFKRESKDTGSTKDTSITADMANLANDAADKNQSVKDTLAVLQDKIDLFQNEVDVATQEMMNRIEIDTSLMKVGMVNLANNTSKIWEAISSNAKSLQGVEELSRKLFNALYLVVKSNPNIKNETGQVDHEEMKQSRLEQAALSKVSLQESNSRVSSKWLKGLKGFNYKPMVDMVDCLEHIEKLEADEKNVSEWIMSSEELDRWLKDEQSRFLEIDLQTPPRDLNNPLSFTSALLAMTLQSIERFPVLAFFCMHKNNEFPEEEKSGPVALVRSLTGQLLKFMTKNRPAVDISQLEKQTSFYKSGKNLKHGLAMLDALLSLLPEGDMVFVILDSLSSLSGSEKDGHKLITAMSEITKRRGHVSIKIIVTDPLVDSPAMKVADESLHVLDLVSGVGIAGIDAKANDITQRLRDTQFDEGSRREDEEEDDDDDDGDEDDE